MKMELKKIILKKSFILYIAVMIFTDVFLFFEYASEEIFTEEIYCEIQKSHAESYKENIQYIINRANMLSKISFTDNSEKYKKTIKDFENILNAEVKVENTKAIEAILSFDKENIVFIIFTLYMVCMLSGDRKGKKAVFLVNKVKGRGYIAGKKLMGLFLTEVGFVSIIYTANIIASAYSGGNIGNLFIAVQSIPKYKNIVYNVNIIEFIGINIILKAIIFFMIGLILWLIYGLIGNYFISLIIFFTGLTAEYCIYMLMDEYNPLRFFKELNIFAILDKKRLYELYEVFDFFSGAINRTELVILFVFLLTFICTACIYLEYTKLYYIDRKNVFDKISDFVIKIKSRKVRIHSIMGNQLYRLLIEEKGILIIVGISIIAANEFGITKIDFTLQQEYINQVYENYGGEVKEELRDYINETIEYIEGLERENEIITDKYNNGEADDVEYFSVIYKNEIFIDKYSGIYTIEEKLKAVDDYNKNESDKIYLINERGYRHLIGNEAGNDRNVLSALIIICICAVTMNIYRKDKFRFVYVTAGGRDKLFAKKLITLVLSGIGINIIFKYIFYRNIVYSYGINNITAPLQSIEAFRKCSLQISISEYLILSEIMLFIGELSLVMLFTVLSQNIGYEYGLLIVLFIVGIPVLGEKAGALNIKINVAALIDINNIFMSGKISVAVMYITSALLIIAAASYMQYKKFIKYDFEGKKQYES